MSQRPPGSDDGPSPDDQAALNELYSAAYEELRRLAARVHRKFPSFTLSPTAVVNEVFMKLSKSPTFARTTPEKLTAFAVHAMRQVLIDGARKLRTKKRGAQPKRVTLDESTFDTTFGASTNRAEDLLALDQALDALAGQHPDGGRMVKVVELRFFGGFSWAEIAKTLDISVSTARRDWDFARPWLHAKLRKLS